jgi:hypothetical protein
MPPTNKPGFVLGPTDDMVELRPEQESSDIQRWFQSTVLISTELIHQNKRKFCSGTLIRAEEGDDASELRVLTNFHCFAQTTEGGDVDREFLPEACSNTRVYFGFSKGKADDVQFGECAGGTLLGDFTGDLAVFKLKEAVPKGFKPISIWTDPNIPAGRPAVIIHHPDIAERFTSISETNETLPAASLTKDDCRTDGDFATDEWYLDHTLPYATKHTCDLVHGSSGSALIDVETGKVLGTNWGGIEIKYKKNKVKVNAATKGYYVQAFLNGDLASIKQRSAELARDAALKRDQKQRASGKQVGNNIGDALCGTTGSPQTGSLWLLLIAFALPLVAKLRRKLAA